MTYQTDCDDKCQKKIIFNICPLERFVYSIPIDKSKEDTPKLGYGKDVYLSIIILDSLLLYTK